MRALCGDKGEGRLRFFMGGGVDMGIFILKNETC